MKGKRFENAGSKKAPDFSGQHPAAQRSYAKVISGAVPTRASRASAVPKGLKEGVPERVAIADRPNDAYEN